MNPLQDHADQVLLGHAPLERVLCQVKFPPLLLLGNAEVVAPFQEALRENYLLVGRQEMQFKLPPGFGEPEVKAQPAAFEYRLEDPGKQWRVTLGTDFLTLDTTAYVSREAFLARWAEVQGALAATLRPSHTTRVGVRYIDRLRTSVQLAKVPAYFRKEILGLLGSPSFKGRVLQAFSENLLTTAEGHLLVRCGRLPPNMTFDPFLIAPLPEPSWVLDLDSVLEASRPFDGAGLLATVEQLAARAFTFFRWAATDTAMKEWR